MPKQPYPNDWPQYLSAKEIIRPINTAIPAGHATLLFDRMDSIQFEQFCWWLLQKNHNLHGCQQLGRQGTAQGGIDLFAWEKSNPDQLIVFECKCWQKFDSTNLRESVDKFLAGAWSKLAKKFVLIIAQEASGKLGETWARQSSRLSELGIENEMWTGIHLTNEVQPFPDIVSKFFTMEIASTFCNEWMQRVGFHERVLKALIDERPTIRAIAADYLHHSVSTPSGPPAKQGHPEIRTAFGKIIDQRPEIEQINHSAESWAIHRPWVHIHCLLPCRRFYPGSASIEIHKENTYGVTVVLSQKWLLKNMLGNEAAPIEHKYRPFIVAEDVISSPSSYIFDLQNCRLALPQDGMGELGYVVDKFSQVFAEALLKLENDWGAVDFPFVNEGTTRVAMCSMPTWLWQKLMDFVWAHDEDAGNTAWHIFDRNEFSIKIHTKRPHDDFDSGWHGIFTPRHDLTWFGTGNTVTVLWQPPFQYDEPLGDVRKWMPCAAALDWLENKLLPEVGKWVATDDAGKENFFKRAKIKKEVAQWWQANAKPRDLRERPLFRNCNYKGLGLVATLSQMQHYVALMDRDIYLTVAEIKALYTAMILVLRGGFGHTSYISSNLCIREATSSHQDIVLALEKRLRQDTLSLNSAVLSYFLSAFMEALNDRADWLTTREQDTIFAALAPVMRCLDTKNLFQRHTKWIKS